MQGIKLNRDKFWKLYKESFPNDQHAPTKAGLSGILDLFEKETRLDNIPQFSYCLATCYHETGKKNAQKVFIRFQPVREAKGSVNSEIWIKYQSKYWFTGYFGRGLVQTTFKENYLKIGQLVGVGDLFVRQPDLLLELKWSYESMVAGMVFGIYRRDKKGRQTLDRYFPAARTDFDDYFGAREIINGDKHRIRDGAKVSIGHEIAVTAMKFDKILRASEMPFADLSEDEINLEIPTNPVLTELSPADTPAENPSDGDFVSDDNSAGYFPIGNSANSSQDQETPFVPDAMAMGDVAPNADSIPLGDAPDAEPKSWLRVEDWKPFVFRWLKRIWATVSGANLSQAVSLGFAGMNDPANFWIYVGAIIFIFLVLTVLALIVSGVLLAIWYVNRKEIESYLTLKTKSLMDPQSFNLGLEFEKK